MSKHSCLAFCPYLPLKDVIEFADWRLGPLRAFESSWSDPKFKARAETFLKRFVDAHGEAIENPTIVAPRTRALDGQVPADDERQALESAIDFVFLDSNPRYREGSNSLSWTVLTADNTELFLWPIDVEEGHVAVTTGGLVTTVSGGFRIDDPELQIRSPLELHLPPGTVAADIELLEAIYNVCLKSLRSPDANKKADLIRTAIRWFTKAWRNTPSIREEERVVFLKTAFEALTQGSNSRESARRLKAIFEALPDTDADVSESLLWSPTEMPIHKHNYTRNGRQKTETLTDLEKWFMAFADARNSIIHEGVVPKLMYTQPRSAYDGPFFQTAQFLLRAAVKASLDSLGYPNLWRSKLWRTVKTAYERGKTA